MAAAKRKFYRMLNGLVPDRHLRTHYKKNGYDVYLTFDDSPHPSWTPRALDVLEQLDVRATFFLVGREAERHAGIVKDLVERGHTVGNHSYSHRSIVGMSRKELDIEVLECGKRLSDLIGLDVKMFRPPWGKIDLRTAGYLIIKGQSIVMWNVDSTDYKKQSVEHIMTRIESVGVNAGDILLFHDDNEYTIDALPALVEHVRQKRLKFKVLEYE